MIRRWLTVLFFTVALAAAPCIVSAQSSLPRADGPHNQTPVDPSMQGIWSSPDCTAAREVLIIAPHYTFLYRPGLYLFGAVQSWRQEPDDSEMLYQIRTNRSAALIKKTNDGLMKIRMVDVNPGAPLKSAWGSIEDDTAHEFAHCAKLFDSGTDFGQDEVNALFQLDVAFKGCRDVKQEDFKTASSCHKALFGMADSNRDKSLDHAELARVYRQVFFALGASVTCNGIDYPQNSKAEAEDFAASILGTDKSITYDQLLARISVPGFIKGRIFTFIENTGNMPALLPFIPKPEMPKTCAMMQTENQMRLGTVPLEGNLKDPTLPVPDEKTDGPAPLPAQTHP